MPTVTIYADKDAGIDQNNPASNFNGGAPNPGIGRTDVTGEVTKSGELHVDQLIHFDLSSIPADAVVSAGTVNVRQYNGYSANGAADGDWNVDLHANLAAFVDTTVTWGTAPAYGATLGSYLSSYSAPHALDGYKTVSLLALIQAWVSTPATNYGIRIRTETPGVRRYSSVYVIENAAASSDPYVSVTYNRPPAAPTITAPANGSTVAVGPTNVTVTAGADPEGDTITHYFEVSVNGGAFSQYSSGTGLTQAYTSTAPGTYAFRVRSKDVAGSNTFSAYSSTVTVTALAGGPRMIV